MAYYNRYRNRRHIICGIAAAIIIVYIVQLFFLQVFTEEYKSHAESNALYKLTIHPERGNIYDRNNDLLVYNQPIYDILFTPSEVRNLDTLDFCNTIGISVDDFSAIMERVKDRRRNRGYSPYTEQLFMSELRQKDAAKIQEKLYKYTGFQIARRSIRQYTSPHAAHVLGDIGEISQGELDRDTSGYYTRGDYIGKQGIERFYEQELRGVKGTQVLLRDSKGRIRGHYMDGLHDKEAIPGHDLVLGLDAKLQQLGETLLKGKMGSIVAIEPSTGEILCLVSSPSYDPAIMIGIERGENHRKLEKDETKPLFNRAIMGTYPPGSTFKTTQGLIFLQENIVTSGTVFPCNNGFYYYNMQLRCHGHASPIDFQNSLSTSCNAYFCWGLMRMLENNKYEDIEESMTCWKDYMVAMGFGYKLGIDLPGEKRGLIPNYEFYKSMLGPRWRALNVISISIGQGEILCTPLQIANLAATIANRGKYITPHVVKSIQDSDIDASYRMWHYTGVDPIYYEIAAKGMRGAVTGSSYGATCTRANIPGLEICGKTGTAQNSGTDHSIFMGFAPMYEAKIAISVYVENGGFGATLAVPIGALMIEQYLNGSIARERLPLAKYIEETNLIPAKYADSSW